MKNITHFCICRCETCNKGFLRRERYVTHVRIHTGEKPFVCAVCSRGYRDKRELKKHQVAHNHSGQSAPIPGTQPAPAPAPVASSSAAAAVATPSVILQSGSASGQQVVQQGDKTIIIQQTVSLPSQPVPKEQLVNGTAQQQQVVVQQPLNPATIPLPPSVASALQSINEKVAARQAKARQQQQQQLQQQQPTTITLHQQPKQESPASSATQLVAVPANAQLVAANGAGGGSNGNGPLFYYFMPGNVPYNISSEGGATVRVTTAEGNVATAQLISVPSNAIQGIQASSTKDSSSVLPSGWVIEGGGGGGSSAPSGRSGPM